MTITVPSWNLIRTLAGYAADAYSVSSVRDSKTNASANVFFDGTAIIVAFKGSKEPEDFIHDAEFWTVPLSAEQTRVMVHAGFKSDLDSIAQTVIEQVKLLLVKNPLAPIYFIGHSLGGAMATLFSLQLSAALIVTFGEPRGGKIGYSIACDKLSQNTHFRVVNQNDIVPRLPGVEILYCHSGHEIFLPFGEGFVVDPPLINRLVSDIEGLGNGFEHLRDVLVNDHFIASYQNRIKDIP